MVTHNSLHILLTAILLIASYGKTHTSQSKACNQNQTYGISCNWLVLFIYRLGNHMIEHIFLLVENVLECEVKVVLTFL